LHQSEAKHARYCIMNPHVHTWTAKEERSFDNDPCSSGFVDCLATKKYLQRESAMGMRVFVVYAARIDEDSVPICLVAELC
jgi:hypothetical protein